MKLLRRIILIVLVVLLFVALLASGWAVITVRSSFPLTTGSVTLSGLTSAVTVQRDGWGIARITADTAEDLFMAQGYVHAQDRFWEMDFRRHVTAGRLSELFGADQVETDAFIRTLGWRHTAEAELELLSPATLRYLEAYANGVNAYLADRSGSALSLEYAVLGLQTAGYQPEPWTPADSVAWLKAMAWDLRGNMEEEIARVQYATVLNEGQLVDVFSTYPFDRHPVIVPEGAVAANVASASVPELAPSAVGALSGIQRLAGGIPALLGTGDGIGSNAFAISGDRTSTGMPLLANDPHLGPSMPGIWYQVGLHCRQLSDACPFDVAGYSFAGVPGIVIGHNDRIAWGFTNLPADVSDLFLEDVRGDDVMVDGELVALETRAETIEVAGGDPVMISVRSTSHGPLLSDVSDSFADVAADAPETGGSPRSVEAPGVALRWTAIDPGRTMDALFLIDAARDFDDFRAAASTFEVPAQNMVYADVDGHIGYQMPGRIPVRTLGDGNWPRPGWDSDWDWEGWIPFEELPSAFDPESGYVVTANNAVVGPAYGYHLTDDWDHGYRAARIVELVESGGTLDAARVLAIDFDRAGPLADILAPALSRLALDGEDDADAREARALLDGWDGTQSADSAPAALLNATWRHLLARTFHDELSGLPEDSLPAGGDRWMDLVRAILDDPDAAWWDDVSTDGVVEDRDAILSAALRDGAAELHHLLGDDPGAWEWGRLHALELRNATFGESGIGPIEWLFNRGPWQLGGGTDVVDATGWNPVEGYAVDWVPSMRMVVDLADLDASRWINLTGVSGHAFSDHYDDQTDLWARGETIAWSYSPGAVDDAAEDTLMLQPGAG